MPSKRSASLFFKSLAFAAAAALVPTGLASASDSMVTPPAQVVTTKSVGVQMFEWTWNSLARECTTNLGPAGYDWVEVSPPQEHIVGSEWWIHYQPVSYKLESKLGTRAEFANMVDTCEKAGVAIIVDAVINHMAASATAGWAGTKHDKYEYPGLYSYEDFHHCDSSTGEITNWYDLTEIQECELLGLSDLNTSSPTVQAKIVDYLQDLLSLGVQGFRVDAAKHIAVEDLKQIVAALPRSTSFLFEVYDGPAMPALYREFGNTFGFKWSRLVPGMFEDAGLLSGEASPAALELLEPAEGTIAMVTNHDTERDKTTLSYKDKVKFELANMFMLSIPYGKPMIYSGYAFADRDAGPKVLAHGKTADAVCPAVSSAATVGKVAHGSFVCSHRWAGITGMIQWRDAVGAAAPQNYVSKGNAYGFSRGKLGFVLFNTGPTKFVSSVKTTLPAGTYCNVAVTGKQGSKIACASSARVTIAKDGTAKLNLPAWSAVAISKASKLK
jgi:alpha-amylase